ncbi:MAG: hypothetical protein ACRC7P_04440, partial [Enterovibrio sp.]
MLLAFELQMLALKLVAHLTAHHLLLAFAASSVVCAAALAVIEAAALMLAVVMSTAVLTVMAMVKYITRISICQETGRVLLAVQRLVIAPQVKQN